MHAAQQDSCWCRAKVGDWSNIELHQETPLQLLMLAGPSGPGVKGKEPGVKGKEPVESLPFMALEGAVGSGAAQRSPPTGAQTGAGRRPKPRWKAYTAEKGRRRPRQASVGQGCHRKLSQDQNPPAYAPASPSKDSRRCHQRLYPRRSRLPRKAAPIRRWKWGMWMAQVEPSRPPLQLRSCSSHDQAAIYWNADCTLLGGWHTAGVSTSPCGACHSKQRSTLRSPSPL